MTIDPFAPLGCSCRDTAGLLKSVLGGGEVPPCRVHDLDARRRRQEVDEAEARLDAWQAIAAEHRAATPEPEPPSSGDPLLDSIERVVGIRPLLRSVPSPASPTAGMALNEPVENIARMLGMTTTDNQPPDAA